MTIKMICATAILIASSCTAQASEVTFNVEAYIPSNDFYVTGTGWENSTQRMSWNEDKLLLTSFSRDLKMKNSSGGIRAYLQEPVQLTSISNPDPVPLRVKIYDKELAVGAAKGVEVLSKAEAATEKYRVMSVSQATEFTEKTRPKAGAYRGTITMMFETVEPSS